MNGMKMCSLGWMAVVTVVLCAGCRRQPVPNPSKFFSSVDFKAIVKKCVPDDRNWGMFASGSGGSHIVGPGRRESKNLFHLQFRGQVADPNGFLSLLHTEIERVARNCGSRTGAASPLADNPNLGGVHLGYQGKISALGGFQFEYTEGYSDGRIQVNLRRLEEGSGPDFYPFWLVITIEETTILHR
jgi:hypothetical protein